MEGKYDRLKVLKYIDLYWRTNYISPSIREIQERFGIGSTSTVYNILRDLEDDNHVKIVRRVSRGIVPVWLIEKMKED